MSVGLYSGTSGLALGVGLWSGVPGFWSGAAGLIDGLGAALDLNFLTGTLPSTITFSRGSNATLTDSTGKITYAPNNLLTNSESFEASAWTKANGTVTANAATAPDGTLTADKFVPNTTSASHAVQQSVTTSGTVVVSFYAKPAGYSYAVISSSANNYVYFDVASGVVVSTAGTGWSSPAITSVGNGWYRCSAVTSVANTRYDILCYNTTQASGNSAPTFAGDGTSGIFIWGAQLEAVTYQTTPGTYNSTTPKNLLGYTQEFDNAAWTKSNATITANATTAPDGTLSADKLVETTAAGVHNTGQSITTVVAPYTFSTYIKAAERTFAIVYHTQSNAGIYVNLSDGTSGTAAGTSAPVSSSVTAVGNGWYRCSISVNATAASNFFGIYSAPNSTTTSYTGDGTSGIYVWGAQLSNSASLDPYAYNPGAAPTSAAYYGPRFDYDPVTLAPKGLLIEEQRTNLLLRSDDLTTSWTASSATVTANSTTDPAGTTTADTLTSTGAGGRLTQNVTAPTTGSYSASVYVRAGTVSTFELLLRNNNTATNIAQATFDLTNGTVSATTAGTAAITNVGGGWYRVSVTSSGGVTAADLLITYLYAGSSSNASGNSVILYGAQLEAGAFATSYIPTVASQVTRTADVAQMLGDNFASWYNQNAGTFVAAANLNQAGSDAFIWATNNVGTAQIAARRQSNNAVIGYNRIGGTNDVTGVGTWTTGFARTAYAIRSGDQAVAINGGAPAVNTSSTFTQSADRLSIGFLTSSGYLNGHIRTLQYYNTRLPNDQLQAISA